MPGKKPKKQKAKKKPQRKQSEKGALQDEDLEQVSGGLTRPQPLSTQAATLTPTPPAASSGDGELKEGDLADCYLMASLASAAMNTPPP